MRLLAAELNLRWHHLIAIHGGGTIWDIGCTRLHGLLVINRRIGPLHEHRRGDLLLFVGK